MFDLNYYGTRDAMAAEGADKPELPDFCHKCGRCCRSATTYATYEELQEMAARGEAEAVEFLSIFQPFASVEEARAVVPEQVDQVLREAEHNPDLQGKTLTFYHCRYVTAEGLCGIYETRPRCCREAPAHGWSVMPPGCGFEGWQFLQREQQKRAIRDLKTSAYVISQMSPDGKTHPLRPETSLDEVCAMVQESIRPWERFGAEYW